MSVQLYNFKFWRAEIQISVGHLGPTSSELMKSARFMPKIDWPFWSTDQKYLKSRLTTIQARVPRRQNFHADVETELRDLCKQYTFQELKQKGLLPFKIQQHI